MDLSYVLRGSGGGAHGELRVRDMPAGRVEKVCVCECESACARALPCNYPPLPSLRPRLPPPLFFSPSVELRRIPLSAPPRDGPWRLGAQRPRPSLTPRQPLASRFIKRRPTEHSSPPPPFHIAYQLKATVPPLTSMRPYTPARFIVA